MSGHCTQKLNRIRQFLTDAQSGELSNEDEEYLRILADIKRNLENLQETGECDHTATLLKVCQTVLYGDYTSVKINAAVFSQKVNEVKEAESQGMPEILQPKIKEIKGNFTKLSELIKNMDNLAKKISDKFDDFGKRDYKLTENERTEVKFLNNDFETVVKKTADYYDQADRVLKTFGSDAASYKEDRKNQYWIYGGLTAATGGAAAGLPGAAMAATGEKKPSANTSMEWESTPASPAGDPCPNKLIQRQRQIPMLRSMQASEQMIYDVYANTMGMIEELEKHEEHHQSVGYSGWFPHFPKGYKKPKRDVEALIEAELTCLKVQVMSAPREAKEKAIERLVENTVMWLADREENTIDRGLVDEYAANVVQILKEESMTLPERVTGLETNLGGRAINDVLFKYGEARHNGELQSEDFKKHPDKKAAMHKMRQGKHKKEGQKRLKTLENPDTK